jgi:carotenoid cleavage dioxygenase-like enzyme
VQRCEDATASDVEVENAMGIQLPDDVRLKGVFKPMRFEATVEDCIVTYGEIPKDLTGGFYRNGPTWKRPTAQGTIGLLGIDGMVQGLIFEDGRADFRNRWIRTPKYVLEDKYGRGLFEWSDGDFGDWRTWGYANAPANEYPAACRRARTTSTSSRSATSY